MRENSQALFGKRPTEKDPAKGTSPAVDFTLRGPGAEMPRATRPKTSAGGCFQCSVVPGCPAVALGGRVPWALVVSPSWSHAGMIPAGQPDGRACSRLIAAVIWRAQGQYSASRCRRRGPPRARRPAKMRRRSRLGSQRRAGPVRASIWVQASSSQAGATISHQTWFCAKPRSGRLPRASPR